MYLVGALISSIYKNASDVLCEVMILVLNIWSYIQDTDIKQTNNNINDA